MIDTHTHLTDGRFDGDRKEIIDRAIDVGVKKFLCILSEFDEKSVNTFEELLKRENIFGAAGVHPHEASEWPSRQEKLLGVLERDKTAALGEAGLDYHYMNSPRETQISVFEEQSAIAVQRAMPLVVHCREAFDDCRSVLKNSPPPVTVIHCFTGTKDELRTWLDMGFYISFSGTLTFKNAGGLREAAALVPDDRLLLETDSPYLAPQPVRGRRNEPAFIKYVYETASVVRNISIKELSDIVSGNAARAFGI